MRVLAAAVLLSLSATVACAEKPRTGDFSATVACAPATFEAAVSCLETTLPTGARAELIAPDGPVRAHFGFGMMLRNKWGLQDKNSPLHQALKKHGFIYPDDMSGTIIDAYVAGEKGERFDKSAAVVQYRVYWTKAAKRTRVPVERCLAYKTDSDNLDVDTCWINGNGSRVGELKQDPK